MKQFLVVILLLALPIAATAQDTAPKRPMDVRVNLNGSAKEEQDNAIIRSFGESYIEMLQRISLNNEKSSRPDPRLYLFATDVILVSGVVTNGLRLQIDVTYSDPINRGPAPVPQKKVLKNTAIRVGSNILLDWLGRKINRDIQTPRQVIEQYTEVPVPDVYYFQITIAARYLTIENGQVVGIRKSVEPRTYDFEVIRYNQVFNDLPRVFWARGGELPLLGYDDQNELKPTQYVVQGIERAVPPLRTILSSSGAILPLEAGVQPLSLGDDTFGRSQAYAASLSLLQALRWDKLRDWR
jgi:hypothetical protein